MIADVNSLTAECLRATNANEYRYPSEPIGEENISDGTTDIEQLKTDMWKKMADSPFVMAGPADGSTHSEPLSAQLDKDQVDTLFFFIGKENRLAGVSKLMLQFVSKGA